MHGHRDQARALEPLPLTALEGGLPAAPWSPGSDCETTQPAVCAAQPVALCRGRPSSPAHTVTTFHQARQQLTAVTWADPEKQKPQGDDPALHLTEPREELIAQNEQKEGNNEDRRANMVSCTGGMNRRSTRDTGRHTLSLLDSVCIAVCPVRAGLGMGPGRRVSPVSHPHHGVC